jgi:DNA-3-methyladenine glycosylase II
LRPPRFFSLIEAAAAAVSCQQLSLTVGIRLLNRLTDAYGRSGRNRQDLWIGFPLDYAAAS